MAEIRVTSGELRKKAGELRRINNDFKNKVSELVSTEQNLMGMWDGEAKEAFHKAFNDDKGQMDNFYAAIEKYCMALEENAAKYEAAEQKNLSTASTRAFK